MTRPAGIGGHLGGAGSRDAFGVSRYALVAGRAPRGAAGGVEGNRDDRRGNPHLGFDRGSRSFLPPERAGMRRLRRGVATRLGLGGRSPRRRSFGFDRDERWNRGGAGPIGHYLSGGRPPHRSRCASGDGDTRGGGSHFRAIRRSRRRGKGSGKPRSGGAGARAGNPGGVCRGGRSVRAGRARMGAIRGARSSRALAKASRLRELPTAFKEDCARASQSDVKESSFWRDAKTNARDERATRSFTQPRSRNGRRVPGVRGLW